MLRARLGGSGVWWPPPAASDHAHDDPGPSPTMTRSMIICPVTSSRAASALAVISPKPTVAKTATVRYSALVRVMGWLKLLAVMAAMTT